MATTAVFAEILIIGLVSLVWIGLAAVGLGFRPDQLAALKGWETATTLLVLAVAYCFGVVVDRAADYCRNE